MSKFLPTRLVDLGDDLRIVHGKTLDDSIKYATLSHCWGELKFMKLETKNVDSFFTSITLEDLPQTFKDAIHVARYLGFRYLWIDSLCIDVNSS
jgi:hypothetical protein